jgi:hypothetical protein
MKFKYRRLEDNILRIDGIDQPDGACGSALWFYGNKKGRLRVNLLLEEPYTTRYIIFLSTK